MKQLKVVLNDTNEKLDKINKNLDLLLNPVLTSTTNTTFSYSKKILFRFFL